MCSQCDSIRIYLTHDWHLSDMEIQQNKNRRKKLNFFFFSFRKFFYAIFFLIWSHKFQSWCFLDRDLIIAAYLIVSLSTKRFVFLRTEWILFASLVPCSYESHFFSCMYTATDRIETKEGKGRSVKRKWTKYHQDVFFIHKYWRERRNE